MLEVRYDDNEDFFNNAVYKESVIEKYMKGCIFLFTKKDNLEQIKENYRGIT